MSELTERIELRLTREQHDKLHRLAKAQDRTLSAVVRRMVDNEPEEPKK